MAKVINFRIFELIFLRFLCYIFRSIFRKRVLYIICSSFIFFIIAVSVITYYSFSKCSFEDVESTVFAICDKYQEREALGNLCPDLCELRTLKPSGCLPNHLGKDVVFEAKHYEIPIVVKSSKLNSDDLDQIFFNDEEGNQVYPSIDTFYSMVFNSVERNLNISLDAVRSQPLELLTKLWTKNMKNFPKLPLAMQNVAMNNIWNLVQQTEYLLLKYYEDGNNFPKILGTCGPFYAVEFIQPLDNLFLVFYPVWRTSFYERAKVALKILKFLENVENQLPFLHICDVKVGHFGFDKSGNVKLLDMDMVFFEPVLIQNIEAIHICSSDQDCSFIDCKGFCHPTQKVCEPKVTDNNFQRVCRNIFAGKIVQSYFGLLSAPPRNIASKVYSLLKKCSDNLDEEAALVIARELKKILETIVTDHSV